MSFQLTTEGAEGRDARVLAGEWLVRAAGPGEWRTVADPALDDADWPAAAFVGRWWLEPGLGDVSAVLYRRRFDLPAALLEETEDVPPSVLGESSDGSAGSAPQQAAGRSRGNGAGADERWWLITSGLCDLGHLWLDGAYLGDLRGRHPQHAFEVSQMLASAHEHLVAIEASASAVRVPQSADASVRLERTGPARIEWLRALVIEANPDRAVLRITATVDSAGTHSADVTTTMLPADNPIERREADSPEGRHAVPGNGLTRSAPILARGRNELSWLVAVEQPLLWWPADRGQQPRYSLDIDVSIDGRTSHSVRLTTGIRTVSMRRGKLVVNGEAQHAGLDALTVVPHELAHRSVYDTADAVGTLLCQQITLDPAVFAGAERGRRALAARAAAVAADHAGHHPSVVAWQLLQPTRTQRHPGLLGPRTRPAVRRTIAAADPTRPVRQPARHSSRAVTRKQRAHSD